MARPRRTAARMPNTSSALSDSLSSLRHSVRPARASTSRIIPNSHNDSLDDDDDIAVVSSSRRVFRAVAIPTSRPSKSSAVSPTNSTMTSIVNTSRDSSIEHETPGTTPDTSVRSFAAAKRKRSTLLNTVAAPEQDSDMQLALQLQEEEFEAGDAQVSKKRVKLTIADTEDELTELSELESLCPLETTKRKLPLGTGTSRAKPASRASSSNRSLSKIVEVEDSDCEDEVSGGAGSDDSFVDADSAGFDSDVPLSSLQKSAAKGQPASIASAASTHGQPCNVAAVSKRRKLPSGRKRSKGKAGRRIGRHGRITAEEAEAIGDDIEGIVLDGMLSRKDKQRRKLERAHPEIKTMWKDLQATPVIQPVAAAQPESINRRLKPFQLQGLDWMVKQEQTQYKGGLLGDEMGMGKTIQAVSLIMSDYPQKQPTLVVVPPVALMQWSSEIKDYTDGKLSVLVYHGQNSKVKSMSVKDLKKFDVIMISYNSLESLHRKETKGWSRGEDIIKEDSPIHAIQFHRLILDEAHSIKTRTTGVAKACFALNGTYKWCLSGTPVQNRIGEFFSLLRFLSVRPFSDYFCKRCPCAVLHWEMTEDHRCKACKHTGMEHVSVFNQELLNPLTQSENPNDRKAAMSKLHLITARIMLRRMKRDHTSTMELPPKEVVIHNEFFGEIERDFSSSIMTNTTRAFDTYVARGVMLNNYANIFGLIMQMRQVANHPDLLLKRHGEEGQNVIVCNVCDDVAEEAVRSQCKHDFCRSCVKSYIQSMEESGSEIDCPRCHIALAIDIEQPEIAQDEEMVKKTSIINRIKMDNWTSSTKIEMLIYDLYKLRSKKQTLKSIVFSQFTSMLQLIEWRLRRAGFNTVLLDGSMSPIQRQKSIEHFMTNPDCEIFLVSLKAGGVALNLTEASRVFLVDPWWNPATEWQSADRCHRIGQRRPCVITRLVIEDSVESRMVMLQEKKANMINSTINNDTAAMEKLTPEDMQFLFRGS